MPPLTADEKQRRQWEAEEDANTLARAEEIKSKKGRFNRAKTAAVKIAKEQKERASAMEKVARGMKIVQRGKK